MKHYLLSSIAISLLLTGCGATKTITYSLGISTDNQEYRRELILSSKRVIERRAQAIGEAIESVDIHVDGDKVDMEVELKNDEGNPFLTQALSEPFKLRINEESSIEEADIIAMETDGYKETGITEQDILWLVPATEAENKGRVTVQFTEEGRAKMGKVFENNNGKYIGLFVRDRLIAKLLVDTDQVKDDIIISEIPSVDLAYIFADDVNVGLYVTFSQK